MFCDYRNFYIFGYNFASFILKYLAAAVSYSGQ